MNAVFGLSIRGQGAEAAAERVRNVDGRRDLVDASDEACRHQQRYSDDCRHNNNRMTVGMPCSQLAGICRGIYCNQVSGCLHPRFPLPPGTPDWSFILQRHKYRARTLSPIKLVGAEGRGGNTAIKTQAYELLLVQPDERQVFFPFHIMNRSEIQASVRVLPVQSQ